MTASNRQLHIEQALAEYRSKPPGVGETLRVPFRGSSAVLEVIEVPLDIPLLNTNSFRIAPALADHPQRDVVSADPESAAAQEIVADLVRKVHRNAESLKESLVLEGQDSPGLITRGGKLINANSRCVLLRDLVREGRLASAGLRVAVLPLDVTNSEMLGLESVLQQQQELKDPYNLVSKLMMIEKLHSEAGMTDQQIATSLRERKGPGRIADLREVLVLMERARRLSNPPQPVSTFAGEKDKQENWLELLRQVQELDRLRGRDAANDHIRGWLLAYYSGFASVHQLRHVRGDWVSRDVMPMLASGDDVAVQIADVATEAPAQPLEAEDEKASRASALGLDLLGDMEGDFDHRPVADPVVQTLLDIVTAARTSPGDSVTITSGVEASAEDVMTAIRSSVDEGIKASKRRAAGANKLARPQAHLGTATSNLNSALEALEEVVNEPEFESLIDPLLDAIEGARGRLNELTDLLDSAATAAAR